MLARATAAALVLGWAGPLEAVVAVSLTRYPYIQNVGTTTVTIMWRTRDSVRQSVLYGEGGVMDREVTEAEATKRHEVTLTGLRPGARYSYKLSDWQPSGALTAEDMAFTTDAGRGLANFSFFVTADIGERIEAGTHQHQTVAMLRSQVPRPAFGLLAGDIVYPDGDSDDYDTNFMTPWRDLLINTCVWPALGNHDWGSNPETNFVREWSLPNNEHYYSFDYGNAHFIALDSKNGSLHERTQQLAWLEQDLALQRGGAAWTFVYLHHPFMTCTYKGHLPELAQDLIPIFQQYEVDVVFTGHAHTYERLYPNLNGFPVDRDMDPVYKDPTGIIYITSGCGGQAKPDAPTTACGLNAFYLDEKILFTRVYVLDNTLFIVTLDSYTGELVDGVSITKTLTTSDLRLAPPQPRLWQNVPNPFNPATAIAYEIPLEALASLDVYRADGRWIVNLARRVHPPGSYRVLWNGRDESGADVPSGMYFAKLRTAGEHAVVKMLLLR